LVLAACKSFKATSAVSMPAKSSSSQAQRINVQFCQ
jgi:hypothetical protein